MRLRGRPDVGRATAIVVHSALLLAASVWPQRAIAQAPSGPTEAGTHPAADPPPVAEARGLSRLILLPRIGVLAGGGGEANLQCAPCEGEDDRRSYWRYDERSRFALGIDVLVPVGSIMRFGIGPSYVPAHVIDPGPAVEGGPPESGDYELGSELTLVGVVEGVVPVWSSLSLALRGQLGAYYLFEGGDLEDDNARLEAVCQAAGRSPEYSGEEVSCSVDEGPYPGFTYGVGAGVLFAVGPVRLRADFLYQGYYLAPTFMMGLTSERIVVAESLYEAYGSRYWLVAGVELSPLAASASGSRTP